MVKAMKNKLLLSIILVVMIFFANDDVYAKFQIEDVRVECYYGNGIVAL